MMEWIYQLIRGDAHGLNFVLDPLDNAGLLIVCADKSVDGYRPPYIARLTGMHPTYRYTRVFVGRKQALPERGASIVAVVARVKQDHLEDGDVLEYRGIDTPATVAKSRYAVLSLTPPALRIVSEIEARVALAAKMKGDLAKSQVVKALATLIPQTLGSPWVDPDSNTRAIDLNR